MTTPIVIETVRNGNAVSKPSPKGPEAPATPTGARTW